MYKNNRERFFETLSPNSGVTQSVLRSLSLYFGNRQNKYRRAAIEADMERLSKASPRLSGELRERFHNILKSRCCLPNGLWRDTNFTRLWGPRERRIMDQFHALELVGFYDDQTSQSRIWERRNRAGCESAQAIPIYCMIAANGESFDFILRNWQRGGEPIQFI